MNSSHIVTTNMGKKKMLNLPSTVTVTIPTNSQFLPMDDELRRSTGITIFTAANQTITNNMNSSVLSNVSHGPLIPSLHHQHQETGVGSSVVPHQTMVTASTQQQPINSTMPVKQLGHQLECGKWKCAYCPSTYKHKPHLARHMITHSGEKPFACNFCNKRYFRKDNYEIHLKSHAEEKPFVCSYCSKEFLRKNNFERHVRLHTGEKPYACPYCLHRSIRKDTLEGHVYRNHTRDLQVIDKDDDLSSSSEEDNPS